MQTRILPSLLVCLLLAAPTFAVAMPGIGSVEHGARADQDASPARDNETRPRASIAFDEPRRLAHARLVEETEIPWTLHAVAREPMTLTLQVVSTLPEGWAWRFEPPAMELQAQSRNDTTGGDVLGRATLVLVAPPTVLLQELNVEVLATGADGVEARTRGHLLVVAGPP